MWDPRQCDFTKFEASNQYIHGLVKLIQGNMQFHFTVVYGLHTIHDRGALWPDLKGLAEYMKTP